MDKIKASRSLRLRRAGITLVIIGCGLMLRLGGYEAGLPYFLVKYGGSELWGMMVFFLLATIFASAPVSRIFLMSLVIAILSEFFRLYHTVWLDEFRLTLAGALLLGRIFSPYNLIAYGFGISLAAIIEARIISATAKRR